MPTVYEPVHRGVRSSVDPAFLEEGELVQATNCRYKNGDPALWQAEGRALIGSGGHGDGQPIRNPVSVSWSNNTLFPGRESEIIWPYGTLTKAIPASPNPDAPEMALSAAATVTGVMPWSVSEVVALPDGSGHALLTGYRPYFLFRSSSSERVQSFGVRSAEIQLYATGPAGTQVTGGAGTAIGAGYHYYWCTVYNSVTGHESATTSTYVLRVNIPTGVVSYTPYIGFADVDRHQTDGDYIRVYRASLQSDGTISPFPMGRRVAQVSIASLQALDADWLTAENVYGYPLVADTVTGDALQYKTEYETVVTSVGGGTSTVYSRAPQAPNCYTGDVFEGSLVVGDKSNPIVYFSYPEEYHKFPVPYYVRFPSRVRDNPTAIRSLGRTCIVAMRNSVWRLNWLPSQSDFDLSSGRVFDVVAEGYGCINNRAAAKFHMPGLGPMVAFASQRGIYATDGDQMVELTKGIDWARTVSLDADVMLVNNPSEYRLELYYRDPNYARVEHGMYLHYHESHLSDGRPAVTFVHRPGGVASATLVYMTDGESRVMTTDYDDNFLYEGIGFEDESSTTPLTWEVRTREIYPGGLNSSVAVKRLLCHAKSSDVGLDNFLVGVWKGPKQLGKFIFEQGGDRRLINKPFQVNTEYLQFAIAGTTADTPAAVAVNAFGLEFDVMGEPNR